jgi:prevent-host-death family protein
MAQVSLAEAKAHLSALIEQAANGETVSITRRGKPIAQLVPINPPRKKITLEFLQSVSSQTSYQTESAGDFMRRIRDDARY